MVPALASGLSGALEESVVMTLAVVLPALSSIATRAASGALQVKRYHKLTALCSCRHVRISRPNAPIPPLTRTLVTILSSPDLTLVAD